MAKLVKTIQNTAYKHELWQKGTKIIVCVSGGPDSVCLLHVLAFLAPKYNFSLRIAHVNYGLRGEDSQADEAFVRDLAKKYNLPINVLCSNKPKMTSEEQMRNFRYAFFEKMRKKYDFDLIAVAHNRDDQVETVLMRIIRGSGLKGLSAMQARSGATIRPLLQISRQIILAYLKENKLKYRIDKSNLDIKYLRNKVRNRLLPYLERDFNPSIRETIARWSEHVAADYALLEESGSYAYLCNKNIDGKVSLSVERIETLHISKQRLLLRKCLAEAKGSNKGITASNVEELLKIVKSTKNKPQRAIMANLKIERKGDIIGIAKKN